MDETQQLIIAVGLRGVGTIGSLVVGHQGSRQFVKTVIGGSEDKLGTHLLAGIAMFVEIRHQRLSQRVVDQFLTFTVLLLQFV